MDEDKNDGRTRQRAIYRVTILGSIGNFLLLTFKFVAAILGRSSAMLADAVHSLSDFTTDIVVLVFVRLSSKPQDSSHSYGHGKYETLATAIIGLMLLAVALSIMYDGAVKIWACIQGEVLPAPGMIALIAALVSIGIKEVLYRMTVRVGRKYHSAVVEANAWHHRSDALSSIGTAIGIGGAIILGKRWTVLDPIAAVIVSVFIIKVSINFIKPCLDELLERSLPEETQQKILQVISTCPDVYEPHNLRTRQIGPYASVEVHVRMDQNMTVRQSHEVTRLLEQRIRALLGENTYVNIHVEPYDITNAKQ